MKIMTPQPNREWTFFSSHGLVLLYIAANPSITQRALSDTLGISERQIARNVQDLVATGTIQVQQQRKRRNSNTINPNACFRRPLFVHVPLSRIIEVLVLEITSRARARGEQGAACTWLAKPNPKRTS